MAERIIEWLEIPFAEGWEELEPDAVEWIDVALFDAAWQQSGDWVGPAGVGGHGDRYARFGQWLVTGPAVEMCVIWLNDGSVGFTNGRHGAAVTVT